MAYNDVSIIKDVNNKPVPQYFNPITNRYEVFTGYSGKLKVIMVDELGTPLQSQDLVDQITAKLDELIRVVS